MYDSLDSFADDALACGSAHYPDASLQPQAMEVAFNIYENAAKGTTLLDVDDNSIAFGVTIVGRLALKVESRNEKGEEEYTWLPADESFPSTDQILKENLKTLSEESADQIGAILDAERWSLLANDAWLLGGIHAKTEFHFASPLGWDNLWDRELERMTVTGREVLGIMTHGYQIIRPNPKLEAIATCVNIETAMTASLLTYKEQVQRHRTYDAMVKVVKTLPSDVANYS